MLFNAMMLLLYSITFCFILSDYAISTNGSRCVSYQIIDNVHHNGHLTLDDSVIEKSINLNGQLEAINTTIKSATINGSAHFNNCTVQNIVLNGSLESKNSTFSHVTITAQEICLDASSVKLLEIRKPSSSTKPQVVTLKNNSHIESIVFESNDGIVIIDQTIKIRCQVNGGKIVQK